MGGHGYQLLLQAALAGTCPGSRPSPTFLQTVDPSQILMLLLLVFVGLPLLAILLTIFADPPTDGVARGYLVFTWVAYGLAALACVVHYAELSTRERNAGIFLVFAAVCSLFALIAFRFWLIGRRRAWKRTLSPGRRRYEDLVDVDAALDSARSGLARTERQLQGLQGVLLNYDDHRRLRTDLNMYGGMGAALEAKRAKLMSEDP